MQNSSLMITDYSSVVFDFNHLKKPTIFYHFDVNDYLKHRGSYVDLRKDLVGDIAHTKEEVIKYVSDYVENDFKYKPKYNINSKKYYAYHDKNNFERIYNEIKKLSNKKHLNSEVKKNENYVSCIQYLWNGWNGENGYKYSQLLCL